MATMTDTTFRAIRTIETAADLPDRAHAIIAAESAGDRAGAKEGLVKLQNFLVARTGEYLFDNEAAVLEALEALGGRNNIRGQRVASYLMVHTKDSWARSFWEGSEIVLSLS